MNVKAIIDEITKINLKNWSNASHHQRQVWKNKLDRLGEEKEDGI